MVHFEPDGTGAVRVDPKVVEETVPLVDRERESGSDETYADHENARTYSGEKVDEGLLLREMKAEGRRLRSFLSALWGQ